MKRTIVAAAVTLAATLPALAASVWLFSCCVVPLCHVAAHDGASSRQQPSTVVVRRSWSGGLQAAVRGMKPATPRVIPYRSFITLGAVRCDRDVGLLVFLATFLI